MTKMTAHTLGSAHALERQMRNWELAHESVDTTRHGEQQSVQDFIALSRAVGLPGEEVAEALGASLKWPVFDKDILQIMAGDDDYRRRVYERMDERDLGWLESILRTIGDELASRDDYFHQLRRTILALARTGQAIFLGRAADLILPANVGLRVRLHASRDFCIRRFAERRGLAQRDAARQVQQIERDRAHFIRGHFNVEAASLERHDLILNMERLSTAEAVETILAAQRARCRAP